MTDSKKLFGLTKAGNIKWWNIEVKDTSAGAEIITTHASSPTAKTVTNKQVITEGKNIGKANETSPMEQAYSQALSKAKKQRDKGYVEDQTLLDPKIGVLNSLRHPSQMLAEPVKLLKDKDIVGRMFVQPKLNGHRCTSTAAEMELSENGILMYSRGSQPITSVPEIAHDLKPLLREREYVDGELYKHSGENLQTLSSLIKKKQEGSETLQYWVYDTFTLEKQEPFSKRFERLQKFEGDTIVVAPTYEVSSLAEAQELFQEFRAAGYEGAILRLDGYKYEAGFRSRSLLKLKDTDDAEFIVTEISAGKPRYREDGTVLQVAILHLTDPDDSSVRFTCTAPGNMFDKNEVYCNRENYIGKKIKVQFSEKTADNIPFHPTADEWYAEV